MSVYPFFHVYQDQKKPKNNFWFSWENFTPIYSCENNVKHISIVPFINQALLSFNMKYENTLLTLLFKCLQPCNQEI